MAKDADFVPGSLHLRKLSVGSESVDSMIAWQDMMRARRGGHIWHVTRSWPKRAEELLQGGSLYWIIKGVMVARQPIIGFEEHPPENPEDKPYCRIMLGDEVIKTHPWPHRPFQGWRYLKAEDAPPDLDGAGGDDQMPPEMAAELKALGLL
ncbi:DUF1489 family protein [Aestuariispira insulae]|uniref:DUF1489 family protein n=1 Tax=Aestuariispira insulae TaxID=1461337 RepID=A0A3D9HSS1_9PROT|nr:DUF1489 domain-containing protein [Aestuariispira insulae]RED52553.1 hypothetical protein DFP90_102576 [Aestuariispira insulae]